MGEYTGIEWARGPHKLGASWNPWMGCHKVSPACARCYAERDMTRFGRNFDVVTRTAPATFQAPLKWKEPHGIFTCSWSDFFVEESDQWRQEAFNVIDNTPRHTYLILTKRPDRISEVESALWPENAWCGASVENRRFYKRIEELRRVEAAVRFLSIEPLLGAMPDLPLDGIHWVIVGGESGANWRPLNLEWVRQIRDRCLEHGVKFFFKQHSGVQVKGLGRLLDGRTWDEIPGVEK